MSSLYDALSHFYDSLCPRIITILFLIIYCHNSTQDTLLLGIIQRNDLSSLILMQSRKMFQTQTVQHSQISHATVKVYFNNSLLFLIFIVTCIFHFLHNNTMSTDIYHTPRSSSLKKLSHHLL